MEREDSEDEENNQCSYTTVNVNALRQNINYIGALNLLVASRKNSYVYSARLSGNVHTGALLSRGPA